VTRFLIRRVVMGLITLWVIISLVFLLYFAANPDPARALAGRAATPQDLVNITHTLGLDKPLWQQYLNFLWRFLHLFVLDPNSLGTSFKYREPVTQLIGQAIPVDISLAVGSAVIWLALGLSVGVLAARRPRSFVDRAATLFVLTGLSMPTFILGLLLLYVFFYILTIHGIHAFPATGNFAQLTQNPLEWAHDLILPWITLALITAATYSRLARSSLLDTLGEDYIRTARAKGLSERRVVYRHALRSAMTPIVTQFGIDLATILGGAIITERVFALPGLGNLVVASIGNDDLPLIMGIVLLASTFVVAANIAVDCLYAVLDPRVRLS
jgi:peptide/nickel transport system permease protein